MAGRVPSLGLGCFCLGGRVIERGLKEMGGQAAARGVDEASGLSLALRREAMEGSQKRSALRSAEEARRTIDRPRLVNLAPALCH